MKNNKKRGFTIVELVIVIAVIGILAAILVPTFTGLVEKARQNTDQQIVYHLNTAIKTIEAERLKEDKTAKCDTMHETVLALDENGYGITKLTPTSNGDIIWDSTTNRFALIGKKDSDSEESVLYYDETVSAPDLDNKVNLWKVYNTASDIDNTYSAYLADNNATTLGKNISVGFDAGENDKLTEVTYKNSTNQNVVIRTNGGTLTVDDTSTGSIYHYGKTATMNIIECHTESLHEFGETTFVEIAEGHLVVEKGAKVDDIHIDKEYETKPTETTEGTKTGSTFGDVTITIVDKTEMPDFSRDAVAEISNEGTKVCTLEFTTEKEDVILYYNGIYEQIKIENVQEVQRWVDTSDASTEMKTAADELANNYTGSRNETTGKIENTVVTVEENQYTVTFDENSRQFVVYDGTEITEKHKVTIDDTLDAVFEETTEDSGLTEEEREEKEKIALGYVARINTTYYKDAEEAFNTAEAGVDTVVILANCSVDSLLIKDGITFDLNGNSIIVNRVTTSAATSSTAKYINVVDWYGSDYLYDADGNKLNSKYIALNDSTDYIIKYWKDGKYYSVNGTEFSYDSDYSSYFFSDVAEESITFTSSFDGNSTALKYFNGGYGTEENPFKIASYIEWNNIKYNTSDNLYGDNVYELVSDIDFHNYRPVANADEDIVVYGNNHTISNTAGPLFNQNWGYNSHFENFKLKDCTSNYSLFFKAGVYAITTKCEFVNVDIDNCVAKGGCAYVPYVYSNYVVTFTNCDVTNSTISDENGCQGFIGTFVGNSKANVTIDNCTMSASYVVASMNYSAGGFIGSSAGTIKNSTISSTSRLQHKGTSSISAFGGGTRTDCTFYASITTNTKSQAKFEEFSENGVWISGNPIATADNFTLNEDGSITYTGTSELVKVKVNQKYTMNHFKDGVYDQSTSGYPANIEDSYGFEFTSISSESDIKNAYRRITNIRHVGANYPDTLDYTIDELPNEAEYNTRNVYVDEDGVLYIKCNDGVGDPYDAYVSGTKAGENGSVDITVFIFIYSAQDELLTTVTKTYSFQPTAVEE